MNRCEYPGHGGPWEGRLDASPIPDREPCPMSESTISGSHDDLCTLADLRAFVHQTLCGKEGLLADQFPLSEMALTRRTRFCGLQFSLQGPREVRLGAIWARDHNVVYFYDARGERYLKIKLLRRIVVDEANELREAA